MRCSKQQQKNDEWLGFMVVKINVLSCLVFQTVSTSLQKVRFKMRFICEY